MKYALFLGCNIPARVVQYETAARAVMRKLGIQLVDNRDFKCCGYPVRNLDRKAFLLSASENLARAEKMGLNIVALCKCCFGSLKEAEHFLKEEGDVQEEIKNALSQKRLRYEGKFEVKHFLSVLYHDLEPFKGLGDMAFYLIEPNIMIQYGKKMLNLKFAFISQFFLRKSMFDLFL